MSEAAAVGGRIRERRAASGRTQAELAGAVGISPSYLALIEKGRRRAPAPLLGRLADALHTNRATLNGRVDPALLDALTHAAGAFGERSAEDAADLARRMPGWATVVAHLQRALDGARRDVVVHRERAAYDPRLASMLHELRTAAAGVRATASILVGMPELDRAWSDRFHASLDADARRLAAGAEALAAHLDPAPGGVTPPEAVSSDGPAATRLRREMVADAGAPLPASVDNGGSARALRRRAVVDPRAALLVVDAAGAPVLSRPVPGFPLPERGCARWPVFDAMTRPLHPVSAIVEMPDGARWCVDAAVEVVAQTPHGPVLEATMIVLRDGGATGDAIPVGPTCRVCPRSDCAARRDPLPPGWTGEGEGG